MQRFVGSILIVSATTWAGVLYGKEQQQYLENMMYLRHVICMIRNEIEYSNLPLSEVFKKVAVCVKEPYRSWLHTMEHQMINRREAEFQKIWRGAVENCLMDLYLKKDHKRQIVEIGNYIGKMGRRTESENLEFYMEQFHLEIKKLRKEIREKKRIGNCIGVMGGLFLVIILI